MLGPSIIGGGVGRDGQPGEAGSTPVLQAGNASALAYGAPPQVALRETAPHTYAVDISWPVAKDGTPGGKGDTGATPTLQVGNVTALAAGAAATAAVRAIGGNAYAIDLGIPVGAAGGKGDAGATPTLQVGNVTSLASGAAATAAVRSLGGNAYAIDLGLPVGAAGAAGVAAWGAVAPWAANTNYTSVAPASIVTYDDGGGTQTYVAKAGLGAFTSGATFNAANWTLIAGHAAAAAAKVTRRVQVGTERIVAGGTWTVANADSIAPGWDECDVRCISGGSSGWTQMSPYGNGGAYGGYAGAVAQRNGLRRADLVAAGGSVATTVGVGGAAPANSANASMNGGTGSAFGAYVRSAAGLSYSSSNLSTSFVANFWAFAPASQFEIGAPGGNDKLRGQTNANTWGGYSASASVGPGSGGGAGWSSGNSAAYGGAGGNGDTAQGNVSGGAGGSTGAGAAGSDGVIGSFGGGGGGGASMTPAPYATSGGKGGFPGGGGGGAGAATANSTGYLGAAGPGGNGAIDIFYFKRVAE